MSGLDFSYFQNLGEHFLLEMTQRAEAGAKVAGIYCIFAPLELIRAAGAIPVGLCGKKQEPIAAAEKELPTRLCPLIKSSYGYAVTGACPFFAASDFIVGETTCDGKKKMFEYMQRLKPVHLMQLPYRPDGQGAREFWLEQIKEFGRFVSRQTGKEAAPEELERQIVIHNRIRQAYLDLSRLMARPAPPLTGLQMMTVTESKNLYFDAETHLAKLAAFLEEAGQAAPAVAENAPRILVTGCPVGKGSEKVIRLVEELGGVVVVMENCSGIKGFARLVAEGTGDPMRAIADYYLGTPCSCMTPNDGRLDLVGRLARDYRADGVIDITWLYCHTYNLEAPQIKKLSQDGLALPYLQLETDYASGDLGNLQVRLEAFLEMIGQG